MAILSFQEKQLIERVFGMGGGYVLNFTNREFEEFMKDVYLIAYIKNTLDYLKQKCFVDLLKKNQIRMLGK